MTVSRFGVSLEKELLDALDKYAKDNSFSNRSQAIRFLIEKNLVEKKWMCDNIVAGAVTLVYSANKADLISRLQEIQRENKTDLKPYENAVNLLLQIRLEAKQNKDWATSDKIRNELTKSGFNIKDTSDGFSWELKDN